MKIQLLSDIHLEFYADNGDTFFDAYNDAKTEEPDVLVLAGDVCAASKIADTLKRFRAAQPRAEIVYIPGNHEYYGHTRREVRRALGNFGKVKGMHVGEQVIASISGTRFVACTLWFPPPVFANKSELNDYHHIRDFSTWNELLNKQHVEFLTRNVYEDTVVVTHHLPTARSVAPQYTGSAFNEFFVCPMDDLIRSRHPSLWVHGHTHHPVAYRYNGYTDIACNPIGYRGEARLTPETLNYLIEI